MGKECKIIMLPTDKTPTNGLQPFSRYSKPITRGGLLLPMGGGEARRLQKMGCQAYHLYVLSNDDILEGNWFCQNETKLVQCHETIGSKQTGDFIILDSEGNRYSHQSCLKVIGATDTTISGIKKAMVGFGSEWETIEVSVRLIPTHIIESFNMNQQISIVNVVDEDKIGDELIVNLTNKTYNETDMRNIATAVWEWHHTEKYKDIETLDELITKML